MDDIRSTQRTPRATHRRARRRWTSAAATIVVGAALAACSAPGAGEGQAEPPAPSAADPAATVTATTIPVPLTPPPTADDEVARATFTTEGAGGVPESASIAVDAVAGGPIRFEGRCEGERVVFRLTTAAAGEEQRELYEGTMLCSGALATIIDSDGYLGPVQLSIVDANEAETAWVRALSS